MLSLGLSLTRPSGGIGVSISFDSALSVADDAAVSTVIAQASVNGQDGPHTFTLTNDASGQFAITTGGELSVAAALTAGAQGIEISATNGVDDPATSAPSVSVTVAPANSVAPVVSGTPEVGATLTTTDGTWTGEPAPTFTYQWQRDGVNISGATASTYVLVDADDGTDVECDVTADNGINTATAASNALSITYPTPVFTTAATISAQNVVGQTLTATPGVVDPPSGSGSTISYQWTRDAVNIAAATASTYTLVSADENTDVTCVVTATTNNPGTATATSTPTAVTVLYIAPVVNGSLTNQSFTDDTGNQTYDTSGGFTGNGLSYSLVSPPTGVTISSITGIVTHDTDALAIQTGTTITVRATNNGGSVDQTYDLAITAAASGGLQSLADDIFTGSRVGVLLAPGESDFQERASQTTASGNGDVVGSIVSLDPSANIATAPSDAARFLLNSGGSFPYYEFDGTDDALTLISSLSAASHVVACAIRVPATETNAILAVGSGANTYNLVAIDGNSSDGFATASVGSATTQEIEIDGTDRTGGTRDQLHSSLMTGGWIFVWLDFTPDGTWSFLRFNGYNVANTFECDLGPILAINDSSSPLTAQERTDIETEIMSAVTP